MSPQNSKTGSPGKKAGLFGACLLLAAAAAAVVVVLRQKPEQAPSRSDTDVPLGVEEAVIIRYAGPRLEAQPYRRGASLNLRIAREVQQGHVRVYEVRYVVNLPGEFDLTDYLKAADGRPIDDLPSFRVRGLTSLTKDIETRIREIEAVGVHIWHGYYETLAALGVFWGLWLVGLVFIGRPKREPQPLPPPPGPSIAEQIEQYLRRLAEGALSTEERARLEVLLIAHWRGQLDLKRDRMAAACRRLQQSDSVGRVYRELEVWLHDPGAPKRPDVFLQAYRSQTRVGADARQREAAP